LRILGFDDEAVVELMTAIDLFSGLNSFNIGARTAPDEKRWYGWIVNGCRVYLELENKYIKRFRPNPDLNRIYRLYSRLEVLRAR
jgi:hypothetical protein